MCHTTKTNDYGYIQSYREMNTDTPYFIFWRHVEKRAMHCGSRKSHMSSKRRLAGEYAFSNTTTRWRDLIILHPLFSTTREIRNSEPKVGTENVFLCSEFRH